MKLFHWYQVEALREWSSVDLIVMAESLEKAVEQVEEGKAYGMHDKRPKMLSAKLKEEIRSNPKENLRVYHTPTVIHLWGSA